jgi:Icc-related predicted phosphoesterase
MKLRLSHVSDTHGHLPFLKGRTDIVVHSGDFMPNRFDDAEPDPVTKQSLRGVPYEEEAFQTEWIDQHATAIKQWLGGRAFFFCAGNHDFVDPTPRLRAEGIKAVNLTSRVHTYDGLSFIGFPWCPYDVRPWNYAIPIRDMQREVDRLKQMISEGGPEVILVAHCPPAGLFDVSRGTSYGNTALANLLSYGTHDPLLALLCGHIHTDHGVAYEDGMLVSQAATTVHNLMLRVSDE